MTGFSEEEERLLDEVASAVVRRGMALPAMMFLETVAPLNMVTATMLHLASPLWRVVLPASRIDSLAQLLERRGAIPELARRIDDADERRRRGEKTDSTPDSQPVSSPDRSTP